MVRMLVQLQMCVGGCFKGSIVVMDMSWMSTLCKYDLKKKVIYLF